MRPAPLRPAAAPAATPAAAAQPQRYIPNDEAADWHADGDLRARVRRLVRRGNALMRGGYRRLAQLSPLEKGRFEGDAKRP